MPEEPGLVTIQDLGVRGKDLGRFVSEAVFPTKDLRTPPVLVNVGQRRQVVY